VGPVPHGFLGTEKASLGILEELAPHGEFCQGPFACLGTRIGPGSRAKRQLRPGSICGFDNINMRSHVPTRRTGGDHRVGTTASV
jgi:hypothetical protein